MFPPRPHLFPYTTLFRSSAMQLAQKIGKPYREGFVKNRYVGRTFIMPGQSVRKKSVRQKLNAIGVEFKGDRKSTRLNSSHGYISYAVFCLKKKTKNHY